MEILLFTYRAGISKHNAEQTYSYNLIKNVNVTYCMYVMSWSSDTVERTVRRSSQTGTHKIRVWCSMVIVVENKNSAKLGVLYVITRNVGQVIVTAGLF